MRHPVRKNIQKHTKNDLLIGTPPSGRKPLALGHQSDSDDLNIYILLHIFYILVILRKKYIEFTLELEFLVDQKC